MKEKKVIAVIGGGAAGFFGAIASAEANSECRVILLEKNRQVLSKVRISGGGRCNVTHACFDPILLTQNYPRGGKALRGPFTRFQPRDTVQWFESRGVKLKTEGDGRMFPVTDNSTTIVNCLVEQVRAHGVELRTERGVSDFRKEGEKFHLTLSNGELLICDCVLVATGSSPKVYEWLQAFGHTIVPQVPSLFTFNVPTSPLLELSGIAVQDVRVALEGSEWVQRGAVLLTHWGFSGPAVLKLSAWAARDLHDRQYKTSLKINWLPSLSYEQVKNSLGTCRKESAQRLISVDSPFELPRKLWKALAEKGGIPSQLRWSSLSVAMLQELCKILTSDSYQIEGKSTYKEEFVTCGGVSLDEINFKTMESRVCPGLYFAGEVLDIDGVTGGFNFQSAWTTSWLAGQAMAKERG